MTNHPSDEAATGDAGDEQREFPRFEVTAYVDYSGSEILLYHRIENISLGGMCIQTAAVEELGTIVDVVINFPDLDAMVSAQGEVVWVNREPPRDMGIRFIDLDEERKNVLRAYLEKVRS
ncbi:MAG: PilZ domain-containing protein [Myxococcales bacterium]|nr:PilZ domain-containing protein [Myxococcales bacterium]